MKTEPKGLDKILKGIGVTYSYDSSHKRLVKTNIKVFERTAEYQADRNSEVSRGNEKGKDIHTD